MALALGLAVLALAACGRKGAPVPPEWRVPAAVGDLAAVVRESAVELTWTNPGRRVDGTRLRDLVLARVWRVDDEGRGDPKAAMLADGAIAGYTELATVRPGAPEAAVTPEGRVTLIDHRGLAHGRRYTYVVVTADALGRVSRPSARVSIAFISAPDQPQGLAASPGEREARLAWRAPPRLLDGSPAPAALAYEVLRAAAADGPLASVARTAAGVLALTDRELENDRTYYYAVRAIRAESGTTAYGPPSARVAVTPRDMTPPSAPTNLVAIASEGAVRLSWGASPETDVSGYIVYRAEAGGAFVRVGSTRAPATTFVDREVARGPWRYVVTAEDSGAIRNESARSNEATVAVP
ncbi:MAG: hypothetical protein HYU25_05395 [Candidatus Rokubacteria bacterium]|nr:hypothetical protein [Candidatus Rokubacteria bacterium]